MNLSVELFQKTVERLKGEGVMHRTEKRGAPRVGLRAQICLQPVGRSGLGRPLSLWTRDISRMGLGVISPQKLKVGEHYLLTLPSEDASESRKPLAFYCTTRCCQSLAAGIFAVGLSFENMRTMQFPPASSGKAAADKAAAEKKEIASRAGEPANKKRGDGSLSPRLKSQAKPEPHPEQERIRRAILD